MNGSELSRKERQKLQDRKLIIDTAARLFSEKGFHEVSMTEIAAAAEFSVGTLYNFFESKDKLYETIIREWATEILNRSKEILTQDKDVRIALKEYMESINNYIMERQSMVRFHFLDIRFFSRPLDSKLDKDLKHHFDEMHCMMTALCRRGIEQGTFRSTDPSDMATALSGIFDAFLIDWVARPEGNPDGIRVGVILDMFLGGVTSGKESQS